MGIASSSIAGTMAGSQLIIYMFMYLEDELLIGLRGKINQVPLHRTHQWCLLTLFFWGIGFSNDLAMSQSSLQQTTDFSREVNQFRWKSETIWNAYIGLWNIDVSNRFVSDAYIQFDNRLRFRDEDRFTLYASRPITKRFDATIRGGFDWFGAGRASSQSLLLGVQFIPLARLNVETSVGIASDRRPGIALDGQIPLRIDTGPAAAISAQFAPQEFQGYEVSFQSDARLQRIAARRIGDLAVMGSAARTFGLARFESRARFTSRRRDTYQAASFLNRGQVRDPETIEATTSDTLDANFLVQAPVLNGLRVVAQADIRLNQRRVRTSKAPEESIVFETNFSRQALTGEVSLFYEHADIDAQLRAEYGAINEHRVLTNQEDLPLSEISQKRTLLQQADYDEGVFALSGRIRGELLPRLSVLFVGSSRILRHDTPLTNLDDRDEIYHTATLTFGHQRSRYLRVELRMFGSYHHTVFLNAERSAENNVQRTLRLRPSMEWTPSSSSRIRIASEVRATYTTDDFILPGRRSTDQSARELRLESEIEHRLFTNTDVMITASYSDLRLGRLMWDSFTEVPFDTLRTLTAWARVQSGKRLRGEIGWKIFVRTDYDRAISVSYQLPTDTPTSTLGRITRPGKRWIIQSGPSAALFWSRGKTTLRLDAWANWQRLRYTLYGQLPSSNADIIRQTARRGRLRLIPLMSLSMFWHI